MCHCFSRIFMYLVRVCGIEIYYGRMVSSSLWISVDKQMYRRRNEAFGKIDIFVSCETEQCKNATALSFATWPRLNRSERQQWVQMIIKTIIDGSRCWNENTLKTSVKGVLKICCIVSTVIKKWFGRCSNWLMYWQLWLAKQTPPWSLPGSENEHQWPVNDF